MVANQGVSRISLPVILILLIGLVKPTLAVVAQAPSPDDQPPVPYFLDDRDEVTYGLTELTDGLEVQVGVSQGEGEIVLSLSVLNLVSDGGVPQPVESLVAEILPNDGDRTRGLMTIRAGQEGSFLVRFHTDAYERRRVSRGTYIGVLVLTAAGGETARRQLNLIVGGIGAASLLSSQVFIEGTVCPKWWPFNCLIPIVVHADPDRECPPEDHAAGGERTYRRAFGRCVVVHYIAPGKELYLRPSIRIRNYRSVLKKTAAGHVATERGRAALRLTGGITSRASEAYLVQVGGLSRSGRYEGNFYLDASRPETSPSAEVVVQARDYWLPPLLTIILGVLVSSWLGWTLGPGREQRLRQKREQGLRAVISELEHEIQIHQYSFTRENEERPYVAYTIQNVVTSLLAQARQALDSGELEKSDHLVLEARETFGTFKKLSQMLRRLFTRLRAFEEQENQGSRRAFLRTDPSMMADVRQLLRGTSISDLEELCDLCTRTKAVLGSFDQFYAIYRRLRIAHELSEHLAQHWMDDQASGCAEIVGEFRARIDKSRRLLWVAHTAKELQQADRHLIASLLGLDELYRGDCTVPEMEQKINLLRETHSLSWPDLGAKEAKSSVEPDPGMSARARFRQWVRHALQRSRQRVRDAWQLIALRRYSPTQLIGAIVRFLIVVSSGYLIVYLSNSTFGSTGDYLVALLWGSTSDAALKAISALSKGGALTAFGNLFRR